MSSLLGVEVPHFDWSAKDLYQEWIDFEQYIRLIFRGPFGDKTNVENVNYLLLWLGKRGIQLFESWKLSKADSKDPMIVLARFKAHFTPQSNFRVERHRFDFIHQHESEPMDDFIQRIRAQADKCRFPDTFKNEMVIT